MKEQHKLNYILTIVCQCIVIAAFVIGIVKAWTNLQFSFVEAKISVMQRDYEKHCAEQKEKLAKMASLDITNMRLDQICKDLSTLVSQIEACQEADEKFRDEFYKFLIDEKRKGPVKAP